MINELKNFAVGGSILMGALGLILLIIKFPEFFGYAATVILYLILSWLIGVSIRGDKA